MGVWQRFIRRFSLFDLVVIALMAAVGIAVKPVVVPLSHVVTGPLFVPGGAVAGGLYMMWLVLAAGMTGKAGTGTLVGLVQALMVTALGFFGTHGALSFVTYLIPGLAMDVLLLTMKHRVCCVLCAFLAGAAANMSGTALVAFAFFSMPLVPLLLSLTAAALSGGIGGLLAFSLLTQLRRMHILNWLPSNPKEEGKHHEET